MDELVLISVFLVLKYSLFFKTFTTMSHREFEILIKGCFFCKGFLEKICQFNIKFLVGVFMVIPSVTCLKMDCQVE